MSFLEKLFDKKVDGTNAVIVAIRKLRETEDMLIKKQEYLEAKIDRELSIAKKNATINKQIALQALKRKKRFELQLQKIDGTLSTVELQREALEGVNTNNAVLKSMKNAADALKNAHLNLNVDKVYNLLDDIIDQQELANEISNAISAPVAFGEEIDEDELEKELEALEEKALEDKLLAVPSSPTLPSVPMTKIATPETSKSAKEEDDDIKKLQQWAS